MIIVTTLYNAENYISKCIESILIQNFKDFTCYITDDVSTDMSVEIVKELIKDDDRFILIENTEKLYQPGNYDNVIRFNNKIEDMDVIVELDGDDWFPDENTLSRINKVYSDSNVWIANGSFVFQTGAMGFSEKQKEFDNVRKRWFSATHVRTWRAFLWRNIKIEDLKDDNGVYWSVTGDLSFMFPMLEMSGEEHYQFMPEINYVYNADNPLNDSKLYLELVNEIAHKIRKMKKYDRL